MTPTDIDAILARAAAILARTSATLVRRTELAGVESRRDSQRRVLKVDELRVALREEGKR